ncbi:MAG: adenylyltransferase/cytidyltransferase family protein [Thermoplasmata archaeon]
MTRVMATGVFDLLHAGHLHYLREAKKLGDELWVVVATDATVRKFKHEPILKEASRLELVSELKVVDHAVLGSEGDRFEVVKRIQPDVIALGWDQKDDPEELERQLQSLGLKCRVVRLDYRNDDLGATRRIIQKVIDWWTLKTQLEKEEGVNKSKTDKSQ